MKKNNKAKLFALCLCIAGVASAQTAFTGGDLLVATNWDNGLPAGQIATINQDGSHDVTQGNTWLSGSTVTIGGGATLSLATDWASEGATLVTVNDATINCGDDFFVQGSTVVLNAGSTTFCNDDWEVNGTGGRVIIYGGTHSNGGETYDYFGAQNKTGAGVDVLGGTVSTGAFRFQVNTVNSIGGGAVLSGARIAEVNGAINILSGWTGSWTVDALSSDDWKSQLTTHSFTLDGVAINATMFDTYFTTDVSGTTLSRNATPIAGGPLFTTDPIVTADGAVGDDYASLSQTLAGSATNAAGDTMTYSEVDGDSTWLVVASDGALSGTPDVPGTNTFTVQAFDGTFSATAELNIFVANLGNPPVFTTNFMVRADGVENEDYALQSQTLAGSATDLDGDTLTYTNSSGGWLVVAPDGALSGVPSFSARGTNTFTVVVDDGNSNTDTATLQIVVPLPVGGTDFLGGDLLVAANWDNGLPVGQVATINTNGFYGTDIAQNNGWLSGSTATIGGGATLSIDADWASEGATLVTINDATIDCLDDFFVQGSTVVLNAGSVTTCVDDWEANNVGGRIIVNGGAHSSGTGTGNNVGAQSKSGIGVDFRGGTVTAGNFRFQNTSVSSVGGSAILNSHSATTTFSDATGAIDILADWTGSWEVGSFGAGDWEALVTNTANGFTLDGVAIDAAIFAARFAVSTDGTTLTLKPDATAVTVTIAGPVAGNLELTWDGNIGVTYSVETNANLIVSQGWNTWMSTNATETGSITVTAPVTVTEDQIFYRVQAQ